MTNAPPLPGDPDRRTFSEVCEALERSPASVHRYLNDGMPSHKYLGERVFRWSEVVDWIAETTKPGGVR